MIQSTTQQFQIFGDTFIKFYDVVFDVANQQIGFNPKISVLTNVSSSWSLFVDFL